MEHARLNKESIVYEESPFYELVGTSETPEKIKELFKDPNVVENIYQAITACAAKAKPFFDFIRPEWYDGTIQNLELFLGQQVYDVFVTYTNLTEDNEAGGECGYFYVKVYRYHPDDPIGLDIYLTLGSAWIHSVATATNQG